MQNPSVTIAIFVRIFVTWYVDTLLLGPRYTTEIAQVLSYTAIRNDLRSLLPMATMTIMSDL